MDHLVSALLPKHISGCGPPNHNNRGLSGQLSYLSRATTILTRRLPLLLSQWLMYFTGAATLIAPAGGMGRAIYSDVPMVGRCGPDMSRFDTLLRPFQTANPEYVGCLRTWSRMLRSAIWFHGDSYHK
jgi:hypothetical protein